MANMSYCRFHNTEMDLADCLDAIQDGEILSKEEFYSCKKMFKNFIEFCCDYGIIEEDDFNELHDRLKEFFENDIKKMEEN